jgi:protein transport protein SEC13
MNKIATSHEDLIHDAQLDYYGKRLATCSSDRTIKIYDVFEGGERKQVADLAGHEGPVWQVAWAHPKFGNVLASCSYDRHVRVWKEVAPGQWATIYKYVGHTQSVNSITWSPPEHGLCLACASSDGTVSVLTRNADDTWAEYKFQAHKTGCNAVSWAPAFLGGSTLPGAPDQLQEKRLVTGGCDRDRSVLIWRFTDRETWEAEPTQPEKVHTDWVRDVAWAPSLGSSEAMIASCSQDKKVVIWTQDASGMWNYKELVFSSVLWRVSWSVTGNILAVSGGDNLVTLWKQNMLGDWEQVGQLSEDSNTTQN